MFITFEGIDGSGKSTQIQLLKRRLGESGVPTHVFREPGGTQLSEKVREMLLNSELDIHPVTELLLFSSARAQLIAEKVQPILAKDETVILDRYYDSTVAYQGYGRSSLPISDIQDLNKIASHHLEPDITFYLKVTLQEAQKRTTVNRKDRMERSGNEFYEKVIQGFDTLAKQEDRITTIDAAGSMDHTHQLVWQQIKPKFV